MKKKRADKLKAKKNICESVDEDMMKHIKEVKAKKKVKRQIHDSNQQS